LFLDETIQVATQHRVMKKKVALAAIDGTGFETRHISAYFVRRLDRDCKKGYQTTTYISYPTANLICDCDSHVFTSEQCRERIIIPATRGRPKKSRLKGRWRNRMRTRFNKQKYGQRWQVEAVNSMVKRSMGSALRARDYWSQSREIALRVLTHNVMILWRR